MNEFKPGDIVYLKSGGPAMTIKSTGLYGNDWTCDWFDEKNVKQQKTYVTEQLTTENPNDFRSGGNPKQKNGF